MTVSGALCSSVSSTVSNDSLRHTWHIRGIQPTQCSVSRERLINNVGSAQWSADARRELQLEPMHWARRRVIA
jgi:hypothetical protein